MKTIRKKGSVLLLSIIMIFSVSSCDLFDLDVNTDPNNPSQASLELLLASAELDCATLFADNLNDAAMGFVGLTTTNDNFDMDNSTWNSYWPLLYEGPLADLEKIIVAAKEAGNVPRTLGVAQVLKAYYFSLMVDLWGDVPYFEAFKGDQGIKEPVFDDGAAIYADLLTLIDEALVYFDATSSVAVTGDLIYGGNITRWKRAANSLKLRLLIQMRKADASANEKIKTLIDLHRTTTGGIFITAAADDFQFRFSKTLDPDNRHPQYIDGYGTGEAAYDYFGHKFMAEMLANRDPRTPYYFKRQTSTVLDPADPTQKQTIPCSQRDDCVYNYFPLSPFVTNMVYGVAPGDLSAAQAAYLSGFFGRDRSDPSGIPNDNSIRTTVGVYPAGGLFDDVAELGGGNKGTGDGIWPMITTWMVKFYLIEAQLEVAGVNAGATNEALLDAALTEQINKVVGFSITSDPGIAPIADWGTAYSWPITYKGRDAFVDGIVAGYTANGNKLNYALKQAWFANYGNGFEVYNAFRRTGFPSDLQEPLERSRQFALRLPYAQSELNLNGNTPAVVYDSPADVVFWDVLKFQF